MSTSTHPHPLESLSSKTYSPQALALLGMSPDSPEYPVRPRSKPRFEILRCRDFSDAKRSLSNMEAQARSAGWIELPSPLLTLCFNPSRLAILWRDQQIGWVVCMHQPGSDGDEKNPLPARLSFGIHDPKFYSAHPTRRHHRWGAYYIPHDQQYLPDWGGLVYLAP